LTPLKAEPSPNNPAEKLLQVLGILLLTLVGYGLFVSLLGNYLSYIIWGANLNIGIDFETTMEPHQMASIKFIQLMYQVGTYLMPPLVFALIYRKNVASFYHLNRPMAIKYVGWVLLFLVTAIFASDFLFHLFDGLSSFDEIREMEAQNADVTSQMLDDLSIGGMLYSFLLFAIMPAIVEELYFRGMLQGTLIRLSGRPHNAIFISSFAFAIMHPSPTGVLAYMVMGLLLGYLYHYTGNLRVSILFHLLNNSFSLVMTFLYKSGRTDLDPEADLPSYLGILGLAGLCVVFYLFMKQSLRPKVLSGPTESSIAWVKAFEHRDAVTAHSVYNQLIEEGYDAIILNKQDSSYPFGYVEVHVPFHQLDSAQAFIHKLNV